MQFVKVLASIAALSTFGGCVSTSLSQAEAEQIAQSCRTEVAPTGSYNVRGDGNNIVATPITSASRLVAGTDAGAAALNACFARKISGVPETASPQVSGACGKRGNPLQGGTGYC